MLSASLFVLCFCLCAQAQTSEYEWPFTVGSWNVMLRPWFPWEEAVMDNVVKFSGPDVLALQEVWTTEQRDRILSLPGRKLRYPYYHWVTSRLETAGCNTDADPDLLALVNQYIRCVQTAGIDTQTLQQPIDPVPFQCNYAAIAIGIYQNNPLNQLCLACLINAMEGLPEDQARDSIDICASGLGPKYAENGINGMMILSAFPIQDVQEVFFDAFVTSRVNVHATINGIRFGFGHFAFNLLTDISTALTPLMYGALQPEQAKDFIDAGVDIVVGDLNSGPNYQPQGFNDLLDAGYVQVGPDADTWCAGAHSTFIPCVSAGALSTGGKAIDHILIREDSGISGKFGRLFNQVPVEMSDHIGIMATIFPNGQCGRSSSNA